MENKSNVRKAEVILKTKYHWGVFLLPSLMSLSGILYAFKDNFKIGFFFFIFGLIVALVGYFLNYKDKSFVLTYNKVYIMNKKEKLVTINLSHAELIGYAYTNTIFDKILGSSNISFHINVNGKKMVLNYFFVKNGTEFVLNAFYQSEKYLSKIDPKYQKQLTKPKIYNSKNNIDDNVDRIE